MFRLFEELCEEYTYRYEKAHTTDLKLRDILREPPLNIPMINQQRTNPPQCMPDEYKSTDTIEAYRNYYMGEKSHFCSWKNRPTPTWYTK